MAPIDMPRIETERTVIAVTATADRRPDYRLALPAPKGSVPGLNPGRATRTAFPFAKLAIRLAPIAIRLSLDVFISVFTVVIVDRLVPLVSIVEV